mmetsp:Transcript_37423/g.87840  ORF Transcript_37423/g.87840 Transcript_37423/m.87840 type:complete len:221 (-) Transcript_37423:573-1235(-)
MSTRRLVVAPSKRGHSMASSETAHRHFLQAHLVCQPAKRVMYWMARSAATQVNCACPRACQADATCPRLWTYSTWRWETVQRYWSQVRLANCSVPTSRNSVTMSPATWATSVTSFAYLLEGGHVRLGIRSAPIRRLHVCHVHSRHTNRVKALGHVRDVLQGLKRTGLAGRLPKPACVMTRTTSCGMQATSCCHAFLAPTIPVLSVSTDTGTRTANAGMDL